MPSFIIFLLPRQNMIMEYIMYLLPWAFFHLPIQKISRLNILNVPNFVPDIWDKKMNKHIRDLTAKQSRQMNTITQLQCSVLSIILKICTKFYGIMEEEINKIRAKSSIHTKNQSTQTHLT